MTLIILSRLKAKLQKHKFSLNYVFLETVGLMFTRLAYTYGLAFGNQPLSCFYGHRLVHVIFVEPVNGFVLNLHGHITETSLSADYIYMTF